MQKGFDNDLYLRLQTQRILERIEKFDNKLYLEFGGKLFDDFHAARVLPGFEPNVKIDLLKTLRDKLEIIFVIAAPAIESNKMRADFGITYGMDVMRLMDEIRKLDLLISSVVITQYDNQPAADIYINKLKIRNEKVYIHRYTKGYPNNINLIVSEEGYGANPYIETTRPLVVISAPGPASGKLGTCLSQLYHEYKNGVRAGYAKFETFPVWNLSVNHPINIAYEVATADLKDTNIVDLLHFDNYGTMSVNYNRDTEVFPLVKDILKKITGDDELYRSSTDMGVNMISLAITDEELIKEVSYQEIIRRYFKAQCEYKQGTGNSETIRRIEGYMRQFAIGPKKRLVVGPTLEKAEACGVPAVGIMLPDGKIVTGKQNKLMEADAAAVLNAIKYLSGIADDVLLILPEALEPIVKLKTDLLSGNNTILNLPEVLLALSICAAKSPVAELALSKLPDLKDCEAHSSVILAKEDEEVFRKLGINITCEPVFLKKNSKGS